MAVEKNILSNLSFLKEHEDVFFELAYGAERSFSSEPNTTLVKLRQLAEAFTQDIAARCCLTFDEQTTQADLLFLVGRQLQLEPLVLKLFHGLRKAGNLAVHQFKTQHKEALAGLKVGRDLAVWFHHTFGSGGESFTPVPFVTPKDPSEELSALQDQIAQLKNQLLQANCKLEQNTELTGLLQQEKAEYQQLAELMDTESKALELQAKTHEDELKQESFGYLKLHPYQQKAIEKVEIALEAEQRECLLAMATGTGKTRTIIGLMYRFLKTERFKRILFLVERTALGEQATDAFKEAKLEQNKTLSTIYSVADLEDMAAEAETRVQVATVQAMVKRIFASDEPPTVDEFDCIIVDEAHRGYTLDQEMTDGEIEIRDVDQYLSSYRRVLEYFDAIKIGLTATPAKHTCEIFGKPVYLYSYREAVADDWLIDHEPPIRYQTILSQNGINFEKGETVTSIDIATGTIESAELEDELNFDVNAFNNRVINKNFNRVICQALVKELDPFGDEKTMIFCATDLHEDMVKRILDEEFQAIYEGDYKQAAVAKITGKSDKVSELIRRYKNERYPNIAITVDLLTTGIDVPKICHLVFMPRVKSRILYEQMVGRTTRRCDEIGKTVFKIYDPVDICAALAEVNTMKPRVKNPNITIEQLINELTDDTLLTKAMSVPGDISGESQADSVLSQLSQKLMRVLRKAENKAERYPALRQKLADLGNSWGVEPGKLHQHLPPMGPKQASDFLKQHSLIEQLEQVQALVGSEYRPVLPEHEDELTDREQTYGSHKKSEDYLSAFDDYIRAQINQHAALMTVVNRPKDLTREHLKEIRMLLDGAGYSETNLNTAWHGKTSHEIAAGIIGHIRWAALGEPLIPFDERVSHAMQKIHQAHDWNPNQRRWPDRLAKQLVHQVILDRETINQTPAFEGGAKRLNQILDDQLDTVQQELGEYLWEAV